MLRKQKVSFILDHKLNHYRAPLFEALNEYYDIHVIHRGPKIDTFKFNQTILEYRKIGPFEKIMRLPSLNGSDVNIFMQNLRVLNVYMAPVLYKRTRLLLWGIGTSSSKGLGSESKLSMVIRNFVTSMYSGIGLYSRVPIENYWLRNRERISLVGNSVLNELSQDSSGFNKEYFLFIGTLNKRKGINELLASFKQALVRAKRQDLILKIVGDGPERENIERLIREMNLSNNVQLLGSIFDNDLKRQVFEGAYCVLSPKQAGLSVVESFSYGVPFVTSVTAITGGESESIINDENGVLFKDISELSDIIVSFIDGRRSSAHLGKNAYQFYKNNLNFDLYVQRFKKFIDKNISKGNLYDS